MLYLAVAFWGGGYFFLFAGEGFGWEITDVCQNVSYFGKFGG